MLSSYLHWTGNIIYLENIRGGGGINSFDKLVVNVIVIQKKTNILNIMPYEKGESYQG